MSQGTSNDPEAARLGQRFSEDSGRLPGARLSMEDGASSFAALFGPGPGGNATLGALGRRDSQSSFVSSRLDDLGLNLDLPGLQVVILKSAAAHITATACIAGVNAAVKCPTSILPVARMWPF